MKVQNYDFVQDRTLNKKNENKFLPSNIRCLIIGPANCGKTNLLFNFIIDWLNYDKLHIYSRTLCQPKYQFLQSVFEEVEGELGSPVAFFHGSQEDFIPPEDLNPNFKNLIVFDDVLLDKQRNMERYFAQGRHSNADVIYCSQSYTRIPKQVIRDNANLLILFPQDDLNLKRVHENHVGTDMDFDEFKDTCNYCWKKPYSFLTVDKTQNNAGRYKRVLTPITSD